MKLIRSYLKVLTLAGALAITSLVLAPTVTHAQFTLRPPVTNSFQVACTNSVVINQSSATTTELVALAAGERIYVCSFIVNQIGAATAPTFKFVRGTGTNCGTGTANLTGVFSGDVTVGAATNVALGNGLGAVIVGAASEALCITTTTTQAQTGVLSYAQF